MEAAAARAEGRAAEVAAAAAPGSEADPVASSVARSGAVHGMYENPDTGRKERQRSMQGRSWAHPETVRHRPGSQRYVFEDAHESREGQPRGLQRAVQPASEGAGKHVEFQKLTDLYNFTALVIQSEMRAGLNATDYSDFGVTVPRAAFLPTTVNHVKDVVEAYATVVMRSFAGIARNFREVDVAPSSSSTALVAVTAPPAPIQAQAPSTVQAPPSRGRGRPPKAAAAPAAGSDRAEKRARTDPAACPVCLKTEHVVSTTCELYAHYKRCKVDIEYQPRPPRPRTLTLLQAVREHWPALKARLDAMVHEQASSSSAAPQ